MPLPKMPRCQPAIDVAAVRRKLKGRVNSERVLIVSLLFFGVPLLFSGPLLMSALLWAKSFGSFPFMTLLWITSGVMIPLLLLAEAQTKGNVADDVLADYDGPTLNPLTGRTGGQIVVVIIFSTLGPGLVMSAARRVRGQMRHNAASVDRCAEVAAQLLANEGGVDIFSLQKPGEAFDDLLTAVEWLVHYNWVGAGSKGTRVWILSDARPKLEKV